MKHIKTVSALLLGFTIVFLISKGTEQLIEESNQPEWPEWLNIEQDSAFFFDRPKDDEKPKIASGEDLYGKKIVGWHHKHIKSYQHAIGVYSQFIGVHAENLRMDSSLFDPCAMFGCKFIGGGAVRTDFDGSFFRSTVFRDFDFTKAQFHGATFYGCHFEGVNWTGCYFDKNTKFYHCTGDIPYLDVREF